MRKTADVDERLVQSVTRAFDVLFAIAESDHPPTIRTLAENLELPRSTIHRIVNTLQASGVVSRVGSHHGYVVTPKLVLAASVKNHGATLGTIAPPYLHRLVALSEETASLHVRTGDHRTCVAEVQGLRGIRWVRGPGWSAPIFAGAVGRVLMAGLPDDELDELLDRVGLQPLASRSVADADITRQLVNRDRERGWSSSESETIDGAAAVAVPVVDAGGGTVAALSLYGPADRLAHMVTLIDDVREVALELGQYWMNISTVQSGAGEPGSTVGRTVRPNECGTRRHRQITTEKRGNDT